MPHETNATLLILGAKPAQRPLYEAAVRVGLRTLAADPDPDADSLSLASQRWIGDLGDSEGLIEFARVQQIDGVLTAAADFPMPALGRIVEALGLPGPRPEAVRRATDKAAMRAAFRAAGLASPTSIPCRSAAALRDAVRELSGDCIIKPAQSSGGRGVTFVPAERGAVDLDAAYDCAAGHTLDRQLVLVEQFVAGPEYSVEGLVWRGRCEIVAVTDKLNSGAPHFVELGHHQPASLSPMQRRQLIELTQAAAEAMCLDDCAVHAEMKLCAGAPVLIECAARAGGGCITSRLLPLSTGIDFLEACIQVALGREPDLRPRRAGGASAVRFLTAEPGELLGFHGLETARQMSGVVEVETYLRPGARVAELRDSTARCGHVICHCPDDTSDAAAQRAARLAEQASARIQVQTR